MALVTFLNIELCSFVISKTLWRSDFQECNPFGLFILDAAEKDYYQVVPDAQFPSLFPPLSLHSVLVRQVPHWVASEARRHSLCCRENVTVTKKNFRHWIKYKLPGT